MKKTILSMATIPLLASTLVTTSVSANEGISILNDISVKGQIRPRFEYANVENNNVSPGRSYTNRLQLSATAGLMEAEGLSTTLGVMSVNNFGSNEYNSLRNGQAGKYDLIADPQQAMLSEALVSYKMGDTTVSAGRSHLNLDNQRFIGTVGWRQMERSYDTVQVKSNAVENLDFLAAYVYGWAGVTGITTTDTKSAIIHAKYKAMDELTATAYAYMIGSKYDTYGIALTGKVDVGTKLSYRAEYAIQTDASLEYAGVAGKADASYINLDLGTNISGVIIGANYEFLSGSDASGKTSFNPSMGTNHKFNGWADMFYVGPTGVPSGGLVDMNVRLGYKAKGFGKVLAVYHSYTTDTAMAGGDDFGSEINVLYANKLPGVKGVKALVKGAYYSGGDVTGKYTSDVTKAWVMLDYKFKI